jgi:hypothetical protein
MFIIDKGCETLESMFMIMVSSILHLKSYGSQSRGFFSRSGDETTIDDKEVYKAKRKYTGSRAPLVRTQSLNAAPRHPAAIEVTEKRSSGDRSNRHVVVRLGIWSS